MSAEWRSLMAGNAFVPMAGPREEALGEPLSWALTLGRAELRRPLAPTTEYQARVCLFDERFGHFFGRPFRSAWRRLEGEGGRLGLDEAAFFHSMLRDGFLALVVEVVSRTAEGREAVEGWASVQVPANHEGPDLAAPLPPDSWQTTELRDGSPKALLLIASKEKRSLEPPAVGQLHLRLQGHRRLDRAKSFVPTATLIGQTELVPGLQGPQPLLSPLPLGPAPGFIHDLKIHFGPLGADLESELCSKLMKERLFRANVAKPADPSQRLHVRERRLRIGVHNGWCFVAEPQMFNLSSGAEGGSLGFGGSLGRRSAVQPPASSLSLRSRVELADLADDSGLSLVFVLDYVVGLSGPNAEGSVSVGICWGVWSPFARPRLAFPAAVQTCLLAGPSHNPFQKLFLKNLYRLEDVVGGQKKPMTLPHISAHFRFSLGGQEERRGRSMSPPPSSLSVPEPTKGSRASALPSPPPAPVSPSHSIEPAKLATPSPSPEHAPRAAARQAPAPAEQPIPLVESAYQQPRRREPRADSYPQTPLDPRAAAVASAIPRSVFAFLSDAGGDLGDPVTDRHGEPPDYVDLAHPPKPHMATELADPCSSNEILLRFLALSGDLRTWDGSRCVFLTFQFYRFPPVSSEKLLLVAGPQDKALGASDIGAPRFLKRMDSGGRALDGALGYQVKMTVDPAFLAKEELESFVAYLGREALDVEVWDGDSVQLVGTCRLPLRGLLRGGREAVEAWAQLPLHDPFSQTLPPAPRGLLFLSAACVGYPPSRPAGDLRSVSRNWGLVSQRLARPLQTAGPNYAMPEKLTQPLFEEGLDEDRKRKLRRLEHLRSLEKFAALNLASDSSEKGRELSRALREMRALRAEAKPAALQSATVEAVTRRVRLTPSLGSVAFAELKLTNPHGHPIVLRLSTSQPALQPVLREEEWAHLKALHGLRTPLEPSLWMAEAPQKDTEALEETSHRLLLRPRETVYVPFKLEPDEDSLRQPFGAKVGSRKLHTPPQTLLGSKTFQAMLWQESELFAGLILEVEPQPLSPDRIWRFRAPAHTAFHKLVRLDTLGLRSRVAGVRCSDGTVGTTLREEARSGAQMLEVKTGVGAAPGIASFWLLLYTDGFRCSPAVVWLFHLHAGTPLRLDAVQGERAVASLLLRGGQVERTVRCFASLGAQVRLEPPAALLLQPHSVVEVRAAYRSLGPPAEEEAELTAVDLHSGQVLNTWLIHVSLSPAPIAKRYQLALAASKELTLKRIGFTNAYSAERTFAVETNRPELVVPVSPTLRLGPREEALVALNFATPPAAFTQPLATEALVFFSDEEGHNERTIAVHLLYSPP